MFLSHFVLIVILYYKEYTTHFRDESRAQQITEQISYLSLLMRAKIIMRPLSHTPGLQGAVNGQETYSCKVMQTQCENDPL